MSDLLTLKSVLEARRVPPRPWLDDDCDWADPVFSRQYALTGSLGSGRAKQEAAFLRDHLPEGGRAVDLGCGAGRTARALARLGGTVLGIDLGPGAIDLARERNDLTGCSFRVGDLLTESYPEAPFDLAYCIDCGLAGLPPERAQEALKRVNLALPVGTTLILEFPSLAMAESLDLRQDWYVDHESPAGSFPQLVLSEDFYHREARTYTHRAYAVHLETGAIEGYSQSYALYDEEALSILLEGAGFQAQEFYGEVGYGAYAEEESERLVVVARAHRRSEEGDKKPE